MLPVYRTEGEALFPPKFILAHGDVDDFLHELRGFHEAFRECFTRPEPCAHFFRYLVGQFSPLARKSIEPMALAVEGGNVRGMQRFISDAVWDEVQIRHIYHQLIYEDIGAPDGVVIVDEIGFPKKGQNSVGVARQYCKSLGKAENCQVGVFAAYASRHGYALVDKQLFLPEQWFSEAYAIRRARCKVPEDLRYQTQPQLAGAMVRALYQEGILPFKYVITDCLYGNSADFLEAVEACLGLTCLVAVPADTRCWLQGPVTETKHSRSQGEARPPRTVAPKDSDLPSVEVIAQSLHDIFWYRRTISAGTKGPIATPGKFEVKRLGALEYRNGGMAVSSGGYSASNFAGSAR